MGGLRSWGLSRCLVDIWHPGLWGKPPACELSHEMLETLSSSQLRNFYMRFFDVKVNFTKCSKRWGGWIGEGCVYTHVCKTLKRITVSGEVVVVY